MIDSCYVNQYTTYLHHFFFLTDNLNFLLYLIFTFFFFFFFAAGHLWGCVQKVDWKGR